jgi:hypothetical protein
MGVSINITVGRVLPCVEGPAGSSDLEGTELPLFNNQRIRFEDIVLDSDVPDEVEFGKNYDLFSFLAGVRSGLKPILELDALKETMEATSKFLDWLNEEHSKRSGNSGNAQLERGYRGREYIGDCGIHDVGEGSRVFHPVQKLTAFDYDQVAMVQVEKADWRNPVYLADEDGDTYRTYLEGTNYFKFLDWCVASDWQFVIFGFDS